VIWPALAPAVTEILVSPEHQATFLSTGQMLARLSPSTLYGECVLALLDPTTRTLGPVYLSQLGLIVPQNLLVAADELIE
jgi:ABC-2 type transport system permease protein